ncbi:MAG: 30S ribosomal protein S20 [Patescibacteria group bacterium]
MAITSSAKKAHRVSLRKRVFNTRRADAVRKIIKEIKTLIGAKKIAEAQKLVPKAYQAIDKATKMNTLHRNTASRKKSQVARWFAAAK